MKGLLFVFAVALSSRPLLAGILLLFLVRGGVERVERVERGPDLGQGRGELGRGGRVRVGRVPRVGRVLRALYAPVRGPFLVRLHQDCADKPLQRVP